MKLALYLTASAILIILGTSLLIGGYWIGGIGMFILIAGAIGLYRNT